MRRTVNLGDYESLSLEVGFEEEVDEGVSKSQIVDQLMERASVKIKQRLIAEGHVLDEK